MQLQLVCDQGNKFGIGGLPLGIADRVSEKSLKGVQVASVPGYFDGVADGALYSGRGGLEGLGHLGIEDFRDRVDHVHIVHGDDDRLPQVLIAFDMGRDANGFIGVFMALMLSCLLSCFLLYQKQENSAKRPVIRNQGPPHAHGRQYEL